MGPTVARSIVEPTYNEFDRYTEFLCYINSFVISTVRNKCNTHFLLGKCGAHTARPGKAISDMALAVAVKLLE